MDTNVPKTANLANDPNEIPNDLMVCVKECVIAVGDVVKNKVGLVIDAGDEIYSEYRHNLFLKGQPGVGDAFMKWVHDNRWKFPVQDRVKINKTGDSYQEFPNHEDLEDFDISDRKFIAVANAHPDKPPIFQAVDSKWWGWKEALAEAAITIHFLCPDYIKKKFENKMG